MYSNQLTNGSRLSGSTRVHNSPAKSSTSNDTCLPKAQAPQFSNNALQAPEEKWNQAIPLRNTSLKDEPANVLSGHSSRSTVEVLPPPGYRKSTLSPTPTQLQHQLAGLRNNGAADESRFIGNSLSRQGSRDSVVTTSGRETPSFRSLQERYGTPTCPTEFVLIAGKTPLSDIDYQKSARTTLVGELARLVEKNDMARMICKYLFVLTGMFRASSCISNYIFLRFLLYPRS